MKGGTLVDSAERADAAGPYAEAAQTYWRAGWHGVLPLPAGRKAPPPAGYTGADGRWPSFADVYAWSEDEQGSGNVGLRLPAHVIGLDVDDYGTKRGAATLDRCVERWGALPSSWRSGAREGRSGITFYRAPEGLAWPGELPGGDVEVIQTRHRYAVVAPSVHPTGARYRWITPHGVPSTVPPHVDDLPLLPQQWVDALTGGELARDVTRNTLGADAALLWLVEAGQGQPCARMTKALDRSLLDVATGSRHDAALTGTLRAVRLAHERHSGALTALARLRGAWLDACADPTRGTRRSRDEAEREWHRLLVSAVNVVTADRRPSTTGDPCADPLAGLLTEAQQWSGTQSAAGSTGSSSSSQAPSTATGAPTAAPTPEQPASDTGTSRPDAPASASGVPAAASSSTPLADGYDGADELNAAREQMRAQLVAAEVERQRAQRAARRQLDAEDAASTFRVPSWRATLTDELAQPDEPITYAVDELLPTYGNVLLTAAFKAGKTTLINNLTRSLVDGSPFLNHFAVNGDRGRVAIFNYEVGEQQYRRWLRDVGVQRTDDVTVLNLRGLRLPLLTPHVEDWVTDWLVEHEIRVWVLDPFARAFVGSGDNENDNTAVGTFLDAVDVIKRRAGVHELILPTHTGRAVAERGSERARGATRLDDWADVRWLLTRDSDGRRYFRATGRDVEVDEGSLDFDTSTRLLTFSEGGRNAANQGEYADTIKSIVYGQPGISLSALRAATRDKHGTCSQGHFDTARDALLSQHVITMKRHGAAHAYYPSSLGILTQ